MSKQKQKTIYVHNMDWLDHRLSFWNLKLQSWKDSFEQLQPAQSMPQGMICSVKLNARYLGIYSSKVKWYNDSRPFWQDILAKAICTPWLTPLEWLSVLSTAYILWIKYLLPDFIINQSFWISSGILIIRQISWLALKHFLNRGKI